MRPFADIPLTPLAVLIVPVRCQTDVLSLPYPGKKPRFVHVEDVCRFVPCYGFTNDRRPLGSRDGIDAACLSVTRRALRRSWRLQKALTRLSDTVKRASAADAASDADFSLNPSRALLARCRTVHRVTGNLRAAAAGSQRQVDDSSSPPL